MGTSIKHPVPDRVKPSFVIFDIRALWRSGLSVAVSRCQKLQMTKVLDLQWSKSINTASQMRLQHRMNRIKTEIYKTYI